MVASRGGVVSEIRVSGDGGYSVHVGSGVLTKLPSLLDGGPKKLLIIHQPTLSNIADQLKSELSGNFEVLLAEIPDAESAKRVEVAAFCWQILGSSNFTRSDVIIGLGGGAATDLAGFVAATWLRGVQVILVPTTVLGMVDAAIGGKTGINTSEGKNLVGAFHAPMAVVADLEFLPGLPKNDVISGVAEIVKCGFIAEPRILELISQDLTTAIDPTSDVFSSIVELAIRVKARVVSEDFKETGLREILNYGHTLGHAIEYLERYQWRHGAAISIGMMFAAELARLAGRLTDEVVELHRSLLGGIGLPLNYPAGRWESLLSVMKRDKKARGDLLRFIVLDGIGRPTVLAGPDQSLLFAAYQEIAS